MENVKLLVSDFDGIFTDGKLTVYSDGRTSKVVDYKDIMGIAVVLKKGVDFAIISGEHSEAIDYIASKFPGVKTFQNIRKKIDILKQLEAEFGITSENIVYIGDDINDTECLKYVKYPFTVNNAYEEVKNTEGIRITRKNGGEGAFREVADLI